MSGLDTWAVVLSSIVVPLPLIFAAALEAGLDSVNPAQTDITNDFAYLRELVGFSSGFVGVLIIAVATTYVLIGRRDRSLERLRLPLIVLSVNMVLGITFLLVSLLRDTVQAAFVPL